MKLKTYTAILIGLFSIAFSQGTWMWTKQVHSELEWKTISTEHFRVHYHNGIKNIAVEGANIAETVYPELLEQVNLESTPVIDIIFTTEDEIMNGYAMWTNQTFIWVDQNDAVIWLENGKWLYQVLSHELQHIVFFNKVKSWLLEPWGMLLSKTPGWFVEGLAEYMTEKWRPHRADISHKYHILTNTAEKMDPHYDGYSKLLLFAEEYGDSSLIKLLEYRDKLNLFNFEKAFKETTGKSISNFNEHWRRTMNTYYYGYMAQKESYEDIGIVTSLPVNKQRGFSFSPDSLNIAIIGKMDDGQSDQSLIIAKQDTTSKKDKGFKLFWWIKKEERIVDSTENKESSKPHYNKTEIDFGRFHSSMSWNQNSNKLAYAKYHFSKNSSMVYDISVYNTETKEHTWITENMRATYPIWSNDNKSIVFVSHKNSNSNLFGIDLTSNKITQLTHYTGDNQILTPAWSPDGRQIAFARSGQDGQTNVYLLDLFSKEITQLTHNSEVEFSPVWHSSENKIYYTSHAGNTPNIVELDLESLTTIPRTDIGGVLQTVQWNPKGNTLIAKTLGDVDSSRIVFVDVNREITTSPLSIRKDYTSWMSKSPNVLLTEFDKIKPTDIISDQPYKFYKHPKHMTSFLLLADTPFGFSQWSDPLGKHIFSIIAGTTDYSLDIPYYLISYTNAQHGPLWGVNYFHNLNWQYRLYDASPNGGMWEKFDGSQIWAIFPFASENNMHISHSLMTEFTFFERDFSFAKDPLEYNDLISTPDGFIEPESGAEGVLSLTWKFVNRRGHKQNVSLPRNGYGISVKMDFADDSFYGDFIYQRYTIDSFSNAPLGPLTLYGRYKFQTLGGTPPSQEYIGFTEDIPIYFPGQGTLGWFENMSPRGWSGDVVFGDKIHFSTLELRFPLMPSLPINILGITLGDITGAVISDYGRVWGFDNDTEIITAGYEAKIALKLGSIPFFFLSVGEAQEIENWESNKEPTSYVRFALINPF